MATIQVRDVPDDVAEVIAEKARAAQQSVSAYLRELMAAAVADDLRQRAMRRWLGDVKDLHTRLGLPVHRGISSAELVREVREGLRAGRRMIIVDATIWVDLLLRRLADNLTGTLLSRTCVSLPHVDVEVGAALLRAGRRDLIAAGQAEQLVRAFSGVPVERPWHLSDPVRALSLVDNATFADGWYLAMAVRLRCAVMTLDAGMSNAAATHGIPVAGASGSSR